MGKDINGVRGIVYINEDTPKYILVKSKRGVVSFPGGGIEENDKSLEEAMIRELEEEVGLKSQDYYLEKTDIVDEFIYDKDKRGRAHKKSRQVVYLIKTNKKLFRSQEESEIKGPYFEKKVLENLTFETSKNIFKKAIKLIK
jgi:8-oxo-dGTP pyrophosphatase MutT (NUDIX family)